MSGETWLLSATALMTATVETPAASTEYTPEVRAVTTAEFHNDANASAQTFTDFTAVQQQQNAQGGDRDSTKTALKNQNSEAYSVVSGITPRSNVSFINQDPNKDDVSGDYVPGANVIRVEVNDRIISEKHYANGNNSYTVRRVTPEEKKGGAYYTDKEISKDKMSALLHEHHHQYCYDQTIITSDGKTVLAREAPMSLQQVYKLQQADETGSNIAECLGIRQLYIEAKTEYSQSKKDILNQLPKNKKYRELRAVIEKEGSYTIDSGKVKFKNAKGKPVEVDISQLGNEMEAKLRDNQSKKTKSSSILDGYQKDKIFKEYTESVKSGKINPLNPKDFEKEMALIGTTVAKKWQEKLANSYIYKTECYDVTSAYLRDHDLKDIKPNEENYDKALSTRLTVGGYDFSKYVKPELKCNDGTILEADKNLASGSTRLNLIKRDEYNPVFIEYRTVEYKSRNLHTGEERISNINTANENELVAAMVTKNAKVGDKIEDVKVILSEKNRKILEEENLTELKSIYKKMEKGIVVPVTWSQKDSKDYEKIIKNLRKGIESYSPEDKQKIEEKIKELGLDKKKAGERVSEEELAKFTELRDAVRNVNYNYDFSSASQPTIDLEHFYEKKQKESIPALCEYCQYKEKIGKKSLEYKNAVNPYGDADYFYPDPVKTKEAIVRELNGEGEKNYENYHAKTEVGKAYQGTKASTVNMMDFSQPFLTQEAAAERAEAAKKRVATATAKNESVQSEEQAQTNAQTNTSQITRRQIQAAISSSAER